MEEQNQTQPASATPRTKKNPWYTLGAVALVIIALGAVWMRLEKEDRVGTSVFSGVIDAQEANEVVAEVNGEVLRAKDLELSVEQLTQAATTQGANPADPAVQAEIQSQARDMLINTTLLLQTAQTEGVEVTDEEVAARIAELETEAGGADVLAQRMQEFGVDRDTFEADVRTELTILGLLEQTVLSDDVLAVSEEEIAEVYDGAVARGAEVPPLDEARPEIEAGLQQQKEQVAIEAYLGELREAADIVTPS